MEGESKLINKFYPWTIELDNMNIVFKHPCFHFEEPEFQEWDCGYVLGTILIFKDC